MIECPKCGSKNTSQGSRGYKFMCWDCDSTFIVTEQELYQTRLDEVLKKFEKNRNPQSNEYYYFKGDRLYLSIDIDRETKFSLYVEELPVYLSLKTVRNILEDMEAQK